MNKISPILFSKQPFCDQLHRLCMQYRNASQNPDTMRHQTSNFKDIHREPGQHNKSKMPDRCRRVITDQQGLTAVHTYCRSILRLKSNNQVCFTLSKR